MRILAAEPDWTRLAALTATFRRVCPAGELHTFLSPQALEAWLDRHGPAADAVFLPADGPGLALARTLRQRRPRTNLIFMASDPDAFRETFPLHASGYLLHPLSDEQVAAELSDLRYPPAETPEKLRVQTFGNFAVFYRGQPVRFRRTRTPAGILGTGEDLPRIFEKGFTGYNGRGDQKASCLGLYLCRRVCAKLGHTITAESTPDHGTAIRIGLDQQAVTE